MALRLIPRRIRHIPLLWWIAVLLLAVTAGTLVSQFVSTAQAEAARYEGVVEVAVATRPLAAGDVISAADIKVEQWPSSFLPASALVLEPLDAVVSIPIDAGEPITEAKVNGGSLSSTVGQLRDGEQGVTIAATEATPPLAAGDPVDVFSIVDIQNEDGSVASMPASRVASNVRVLSVTEAAVTVAVPYEQTSVVAFAAAKGVAVIVLAQPA